MNGQSASQPPRRHLGLVLKMLVVGGLLGPAIIGLVLTVPIYAAAVSAGEGVLAQLLLFPVGVMFAVMFAGIPAAFMSAILLTYRWFAGPLTTRSVVALMFPVAMACAFAFFSYINSVGDYELGDWIGSILASAGFAVFSTLIVVVFWQLRDRLGLKELAQ